jgi:hypothetical protein
VTDDLPLYPSGLTPGQICRLEQFATAAEKTSLAALLLAAEQHLRQTEHAYASNRLINVRLAQAMVTVLSGLSNEWSSLTASAQFWLRGSMQYFAKSNDDEPDLQSPIGFEDDVEILNACLRFAGLESMCLTVEDYDDA